MFWIPTTQTKPSAFSLAQADVGDDAMMDKEHWRVRFSSRPTQSEIYDLAWSPQGDCLIVGGTDFVARVINATDGESFARPCVQSQMCGESSRSRAAPLPGSIIREISEHSHHIQGVAWDPLNEYIATQSADRTVHVYALLRAHSAALSAAGGSTGEGSHAGSTSGSLAHTLSGIQSVSRNSRMDLHRRSGSGPFVWDPSAKPPLKRRGSSHASSVVDEKERDAFGREKEKVAPGAALERAPSHGRASIARPR